MAIGDKIINYIFRVSGLDEAEKGTKKVDNSLKKLAGTALTAGAAYFSARGIIQGLTTSVQLAAQQELAEKKLSQALGFTSQALIKQSSELQRLTNFSDDGIISQQAFLAELNFTQDQIKEIIPVAADLASATGMTLESAVRNTAKTFSGLSGELGELVPQLRELTAEEMKAGKAVEVMADLFGGAAQAQTETLAGTMESLFLASSDAAESFGTMLAPAVKDIAEFLTDAAIAADNFFSNFNDNMRDIEDETLNRLSSQLEQLKGNILAVSMGQTEGLAKSFLEMTADDTDRLVKSLEQQIQTRKDELIIIERITEAERNLASVKRQDNDEFKRREAELQKQFKADEEKRKKDEEQRQKNEESRLLKDLDMFQKRRDARIAELEAQEEPFRNMIGLAEGFAGRLATAAIEGQNMEQVVKSAINSIAAEMAAKAAIFSVLSLLTGGAGPAASAATKATSGGFFNFVLSGFTGKTPKVNVNINGGLISSSYVRNTLVPAISKASAY